MTDTVTLGGAGHAAAEAGVSNIIRADREPRAVRARVSGRRLLVIAGGLLLPVLTLLIWQTVTSNGTVPTSMLPSPRMVWEAAVDLAQRGLLGQYIAISTQRVLIGFAWGSILGIVLGAVIGLSRVGSVLLTPSLAALRAVPSLAWVPLLLLWIGIGEAPKIVLVAIGAFFPVVTIVAASLQHVDRHLLEAGRAFGYRGVRLFRIVQLPAIVPSVSAGLRLALAQAWLFLVAAEIIGASMGLGFLLQDGGSTGRVDRILLAIILLALLGKTTDALLGLFERWAVRRWT